MTDLESASKTPAAKAPTLSPNTQACLDACRACATACDACATACRAEKDQAHVAVCVRLDQDCAAVCTTLGDVLARGSAPNGVLLDALLGACIAACSECGKECTKHGNMGMTHCTRCAEACGKCQKACQTLKGHAEA